MNDAETFNPYVHLIKLGRILENHTIASKWAREHPQFVLAHIHLIERQLMFHPIQEFLSVFPLKKRYADDDMWDFRSAKELIEREMGTHFGKDDFLNLITCDCFASPYLARIGLTYMLAVGELHKRQTGRSIIADFLATR